MGKAAQNMSSAVFYDLEGMYHFLSHSLVAFPFAFSERKSEQLF